MAPHNQDQSIEVGEKDIPQQLEYGKDGGKVTLAAPVDEAERRLVRKVCRIIYA